MSQMAGKLILNINDDPDIRKMLQMVLEHEGYRVIDAENGETGLALAQGEQPDLILLDRWLPDWKVPDFLFKLKDIPLTKDIPIVLTTNLHTDASLADKVLVTPWDVRDLVNAVKDLLEDDVE